VSGVPNVDSIYVIEYTRHRTETNKQKTQYRDTVNIGYTRHRTKTNKQKHNTEILSTLGTPDTGQRQTNYPMLTVFLCCVFVCLSLSCVWCTQCWQYLCVVFFVCLSLSCVWCTQCCQYLCVVFLFVCLCPVSGVPNVDSISVTNKKHNTEILSTLGTPDTEQRQTNKKHNTDILSTLGTPDTGQSVFVCLSLSCAWCTQC
jgi:hypothetical protein